MQRNKNKIKDYQFLPFVLVQGSRLTFLKNTFEKLNQLKTSKYPYAW